MRSYNQFCAMARALDVVGDRWTLLIVRELLTLGPCRYSDLQRGLPGIASNLLADRLRDMAISGLIERREEPPPIGTTLIRLTDRGRDLTGVLRELMRWGAPLMLEPPGSATFRMHWLSMPLGVLARDNTPDAPPVTIRLGTLHDGCDVLVSAGIIDVAPCSTDRQPDATIDAPAAVLVSLFTGVTDLAGAIDAGATLTGSTDAVRRIVPRPGEAFAVTGTHPPTASEGEGHVDHDVR